MNNETKQCKKCKEIINKKAKRCPNCGAKQGMSIWLIVVIVILVISIIGGNSEESKENNSTNNSTNQSSEINNTNNSSNQTSKTIEYIKLSKDDLDEELEKNAAVAREKYIDKYVEVTGKLGTIDSKLKYISLVSSTKEWDLIGVHCYIKSEGQKEIIKTLTSDQEITVKGKITDVGEVLGYYLNITEISAN